MTEAHEEGIDLEFELPVNMEHPFAVLEFLTTPSIVIEAGFTEIFKDPYAHVSRTIIGEDGKESTELMHVYQHDLSVLGDFFSGLMDSEHGSTIRIAEHNFYSVSEAFRKASLQK